MSEPIYQSLADRVIPDSPLHTKRITNTGGVAVDVLLYLGNDRFGVNPFPFTLAAAPGPGDTVDVTWIPPVTQAQIDASGGVLTVTLL